MAKTPRTAAAVLTLLAGGFASATAAAAPSVWAVDDGERFRRDAVSTPFEQGVDNPVWRPGGPVKLFAMRNESVAFQVVVEADDDALDQVRVDLDVLDGPGPAQLGPASPYRRAARVGRPIERFVEHFVTVERPSASPTDADASDGWEPGAAPARADFVGPVPDALIPVLEAPPWDPYPMHVSRGSNGIVWIDLNVPRDQEPGTYHGAVEVKAGDVTLATLPVELEIAPEVLPDRTVTAVAGYDHEAFTRRTDGRVEPLLWQMLRAHRVAPLHDVESVNDLRRQGSALDGSLYTRERGYLGPAPGLGDGEVTFGARGELGEPDKPTVALVTALAVEAANQHLFGTGDLFLWAADESCTSPWARQWVEALRESEDPDAHRLKVGWTCSQDPASQPVDVPIVKASWDEGAIRRAKAEGKAPWVYGGVLPRTGTFLLDAPAVSPRVNGWLQAMLGIPRWFVPEVARWSRDDETPLDPFEDAATRHDEKAGWENGADLLVYPGAQRDAFPERSAEVEDVFPSIRLKNWRRGLEDAGYLELAREKDRARADAVAAWLVPTSMSTATPGRPASWGERGMPFAQARAALLAIAQGKGDVALPARAPESTPEARARVAAGWTHGAGDLGAAAALLLLGGAAVARRRRAT